MRLRSPILAALTGAFLATTSSGAGSDTASVEECARARLVRLPVLLEERAAGGCADIAPEEIRITEDRVEVPATHFEARRLDTVHAILVDTGFEMLDAVQEIRRVIAAYRGALPQDEPALLATFDDDLVLRTPPVVDRERFDEALEWMEVGWDSPLWDASRQLVGYLASRPERKVLLLLTDGCQPEGRDDADASSVIEIAARIDGLVVFPVWLQPARGCDSENGQTFRDLKRLARQTGGESYELQTPRRLEATLEAIRSRVDRERSVTYKPLPFGQAKDDDPQKGFRWRRRRIEFRTDRACKITSTGPELRFESPTRRYPPPRAPRPGEALMRPFVLSADGARAPGQVLDRVQDTGPLTSDRTPTPSRFVGTEYVESLERHAAPRNVSLVVPPLDRLLREIRSPESALLFAFERLRPEPGARDSNLSVPHLVHGVTLLEVRKSLAVALAARSDYRTWVRERVKRQRLREFDGWIAEASDAGTSESTTRARRFLENQQWVPEPLELETHLAGWLGDMTIMDLSNRLERRLAAGLLNGASTQGLERIAEAAAAAEYTWRSVTRWFPPPSSIRLVGVLLPVYDPAQDVIGFYRVLLRAPISSEWATDLIGPVRHKFIGTSDDVPRDSLWHRTRARNFSEDDALGVRFMHWLLTQPELASSMRRMSRVHEVRYAHPTPRDLLPSLIEMGQGDPFRKENVYLARQVTLLLSSEEDAAHAVPVSAYFPRLYAPDRRSNYAASPICIALSPDPPRDGPAADLLNALANYQMQQPVPCLLFETD